MENMFIFDLFLGNPHLKNEKKLQSADNRQNFKILVPLRAKHLKPHNNRLHSSQYIREKTFFHNKLSRLQSHEKKVF